MKNAYTHQLQYGNVSQFASDPEYVSQGWERHCLAVARCMGSKSSMGSKKSSRRAAY